MTKDRAYKSFAKAFRRGALFDSEGELRVPSRGWAWVRATIPLWAAELARQLLEDARPPPSPDTHGSMEQLWAERSRLGPITPEMWERFVTLVCNGAHAGLRENLRADTAVTRTGIPRGLLQAYLRVSPELRQRYMAAQRVRQRRRLPVETVLQILETIRRTDLSTSKAVLACYRGTELRQPVAAFIQRTLRESGLAAEYLRAKEVQQTLLREQLFEDTDETIEVAGNTAALRSAKRQYNKAVRRLENIQPARLVNRQRAIEDPRAAELTAARRRVAAAHRRSRQEKARNANAP